MLAALHLLPLVSLFSSTAYNIFFIIHESNTLQTRRKCLELEEGRECEKEPEATALLLCIFFRYFFVDITLWLVAWRREREI